jgi:uncharacterized protein (TIGR02444 family)
VIGSRDSGNGSLQYDNEFWRFSLAVYCQAEVEQECLALQQGLGIDVNLLLFCAWLGARGIALSREQIEAASGAVAAWHDQVVRPLRGVRQQIKTLKRDAFENYRTKVKGIELEAEQIEQALLYDLSKKISTGVANSPDAIARNINAYIAIKAGKTRTKTSAPHLVAAASRYRPA